VTSSAGIAIASSFFDALPATFVKFYRERFTNSKMIYGHWSLGRYSRAVGSYHRQIAVAEPADLDALIDKYWEARTRRVGGAIAGLYHDIEEHKKKASIQVFSNATYDEDLPDHTPGREENAVALAVMCGYKARPNDLGRSEPLPMQLRALLRLITEVCIQTNTPAEHFMTHSEAADNLDGAGVGDERYGFRGTRQVWDLEVWIEPVTMATYAPLQSERPGWMRLGDWLRKEALRDIYKLTAPQWQHAAL
jgi:hypothetical protein